MYSTFTTASHLSYAQLEFNKNRKFIIKNIPPVTYEEVKQFIGGYTVSNISISKKRRHAIVTLVHGEDAEEAVSKLSLQQLLGTDVQVSLCANDNMLCVTHLPLTLSEEDFRNEVEPYGPVEKCFLMRSSQTGFSKGYGFVEYAHNQMKTTTACEALDGHRIGLTRIQCSFLDSTVLRFEDLHSRCLLVEGLPLDYTNSQELKNICSVIIEPESFQLVTGERFAVVQYKDIDDADATQQEIDGHVIENCTIVVSFGRPGVKLEELSQEAINARRMEIELSKLPPPLMPPDGRVVHPSLDPKRLASPVVKRLLAQSPEALEKFIELLGILQIQILKEQEKLQPGIMGPVPGTTTGPLMNPNLQIALLSVMMAQQIQQCQPSFIQEPNTQDFILNSLQQQQHQQQPCSGGKQPSSLLGSPLVAQANSLLKNAMNNADTQSLDSTNANPTQPHFALFPGPEEETLNTSCLQDFNHLLSALTPKTAAMASRRVTYATELQKGKESNVCTNNSQTELINSSEEGLGRSQLRSCSNKKSLSSNTDSSTLKPNPFFNLPGVGYANPFLASFIEQQIKNQVRQFNQAAPKPVSLLDLPMMNRAPNGFMNLPGNNGHPMSNISSHTAQGKPGILGPPPVMYPQSVFGPYPSTPTSWNKPLGLMGSYMAEKRTLSFDDSKIPMKRKPTSQPQSLLGEPPTTMAKNYKEQTCYSDRVQRNVDTLTGSDKVTSLMDMNLVSAAPQNTEPNIGVQLGIYYRNPPSTSRGDSALESTRQANQNLSTPSLTYSEQYLSPAFKRNVQPEGSYIGMNSGHSIDNGQTRRLQIINQMGSNLPGLDSDSEGNGCHQLSNMQQTGVQPLMASSGRTGSDGIPSLIGRESLATIEQDFIQKDVSSSGSSNLPSLLSANIPQAPSALEGKAHLVPSPEASPDGVYIGQHSQGLGGHYADSYLHR